MKDAKMTYVIRVMRKQLFSKTIIAATLLIVAVVAVLYYWPRVFPVKNGTTGTYMNDVYGVAFDYSSRYDLTETSKQGEEGPELIIQLTDTRWLPPINGEGPTAITVAIYDNNEPISARQDPIDTWIRNATSSNFHLSTNRTLGETQIGDRSGRLYTWSGLYEGTSLVTEHKGNIVAFTVTYDGDNDMKKRQDFTILMGTVRFYDTSLQATTTGTGQ